MAKKKKVVTESNVIPELEKEVKKQSFKILNEFQTAEKVYKVGDTFLHNDERVINFLRTNKII